MVSKPYVNGDISRGKNLSLKCFHSLEQRLCLQGCQDIYKEVLWVSVGQSAAMLQSIKLWGRSNHPGLQPRPHASGLTQAGL